MDVNIKGVLRRRNGFGAGIGQPGGLRQNQNPTPCEDGISGFGKGQGKFRER